MDEKNTVVNQLKDSLLYKKKNAFEVMSKEEIEISVAFAVR